MSYQANLSLTIDQLSVGAYIAKEWGDYGYTIEGIESPTWAVSLFHVRYVDGSRFIVAADKWGNCRKAADSQGYETAERNAEVIKVILEMHEKATGHELRERLILDYFAA
jgi:hypothetical protein